VVDSFGFYESASANDSIAIRDHNRTCTLSGVTRKRIGGQPKIRTCSILHLKDPVCKITILSTWTDQSEVRNRTTWDLISDRLPCDQISVPRDRATKIATCLILRGSGGVNPLIRTSAQNAQFARTLFWEEPCTAQHRYKLCFLVAKKLTEAADALYGTLLHMFVFSQWWG
jgi:hypothetical protein